MRSIFVSLCILSLLACGGVKKISGEGLSYSPRVGFYNVENLFDTVDHPEKLDDDFTPNGRQKWDEERYAKKLSQLHRVIRSMEYPALLGLCEVENAKVLKDLSDTCKTSFGHYGFVHYESPDRRGIDVALLYDPSQFKVQEKKYIRIHFPDHIEPDYTSRDILQVKGVYHKKYPLHIFVNHWPSRRGGVKKSEPKRLLVASHVRKAVDEIVGKDPTARIIIIGDFNDETQNNSVTTTLSAQHEYDGKNDTGLYNCSFKLDDSGQGTYNYRGNWNQLDQIIVSGALLKPGNKLRVGKAVNFQKDWMMYKDPKKGASPNRTYGGPNYYGGFSDHLPVYIDLLEKNP